MSLKVFGFLADHAAFSHRGVLSKGSVYLPNLPRLSAPHHQSTIEEMSIQQALQHGHVTMKLPYKLVSNQSLSTMKLGNVEHIWPEKLRRSNDLPELTTTILIYSPKFDNKIYDRVSRRYLLNFMYEIGRLRLVNYSDMGVDGVFEIRRLTQPNIIRIDW